MAVAEGDVLWEPSEAFRQGTRLRAFMQWLREARGLGFDDYHALWQWSVDDLASFWSAVWQFFDIQADGDPTVVLASEAMPGARWFPGVRLNYAEHAFRHADAARPALLARMEGREPVAVGWAQLGADVGALAAFMRQAGVQPGERVVSYLPNTPQTVTAFLACASIGAVWSSCSPDMGPSVVLDRFRQIEPVVLFAVDGYSYNGKWFDRRDAVDELLAQLPSLRCVIRGDATATAAQGGAPAREVTWRDTVDWATALARPAPLEFTRLPFDHPLWIVYSSGTTGLPKAMLHSHGGIVLTHLKTQQLQHDLRSGDRMLFLGGTGWIVWNLMVGGLLCGATVVLYDGNPAWPEPRSLWRFMDEHAVTHFGCGAAYLMNCMKGGVEPAEGVTLESLRSINSTGSPLPLDAYEWVYRKVKRDVWLSSISGGTDIASGFVACSPILPVNAGEIQCRELGVAAYAFDEAGRPVVDQVGELVITKPMPSMPLRFWGDEDGSRMHESYFSMYPGCWRQGDWIRFTPRGTCVIYGRSDNTINRFGIRMGTAEIYRVVEELPQVKDSLVVDLEYLGQPSWMPLFVVLQPGVVLDDELAETIKAQIRHKASGRHVPDEVVAIEAVPRTLTGKKMELPVRKLLLGADAASVANPEAMANPGSIAFFLDYAARRAATSRR
jgi:acetoacetyl-CoA synthetase